MDSLIVAVTLRSEVKRSDLAKITPLVQPSPPVVERALNCPPLLSLDFCHDFFTRRVTAFAALTLPSTGRRSLQRSGCASLLLPFESLLDRIGSVTVRAECSAKRGVTPMLSAVAAQ